MREVELDIAEGADMVMVKPGMPYLDVLRRVKETFGDADLRLSGLRRVRDAHGGCAATAGSMTTRSMMESMIAFKRAGADGVLTYFAPRIAEKLKHTG